MDEFAFEVEHQADTSVVLAVPHLRLLIFGRTLDEALTRARRALAASAERLDASAGGLDSSAVCQDVAAVLPRSPNG